MVKTKRRKHHELLYYLTIFLVLIFISGFLFLISPLLIFNNLIYLYITLVVIGISLGAFLNGFIHDLDELTHSHHAGFIIIVLAAALINFIAIASSFVFFTQKLIYMAILSAFVFTVSFLIPFVYRYVNPIR